MAKNMNYAKLFKWAVGIALFLVALTVIFWSATSAWGFSIEHFLRGLIPLLVLAYVLVATRKKPGRRYDKKPPSQADADIDNWTGWG